MTGNGCNIKCNVQEYFHQGISTAERLIIESCNSSESLTVPINATDHSSAILSL